MGESKHVYKAICAVTASLAKEGLAKTRRNEQQGYRFRGIDDLYNALAGILSTEGLCILPRVVERSMVERSTKSGAVATYTTLTVDFDLVSAIDGSSHTIRTVGEAMDTADKSSNKAMSAAMKYACLIAFQIPTEGDNDADATTIEKGPKPAADLSEQLSASVEAGWIKWREGLAKKLATATTEANLRVAWHEVFEEAAKKKAPEEHLAWLTRTKDLTKETLEKLARKSARPAAT